MNLLSSMTGILPLGYVKRRNLDEDAGTHVKLLQGDLENSSSLNRNRGIELSQSSSIRITQML